MDWKEITEIAREGFKVGLAWWHVDSFWPVDNTGDIVIGDTNKINPNIFNSNEWVIVIDTQSTLKSIINDSQIEKLNETYSQITDKLRWFIGPGKVIRHPSLLQNFETFIADQLKKLDNLNA